MDRVLSKDGTRIAYDKVGDGPALILVPGMFSYRRYPSQVQLSRLLAQKYTVFSYDRRGRGDSDDTKPYAVEREIEDIGAIIDAAGESACIWGLSSGAVLALEAAARGLDISKLALHEPPFVVGKGDRRPPVDLATHLAELVAAGRRGDAVKYAMTKGMGAPSFVIALLRTMPGVWSRLTAVANTLPYDALIMEGYQAGEPLPADRWASITVPTLVMAGTESPAFLRRSAEALTKVLPNARLVAKQGLGHAKGLSPKLIAQVMMEFFANEPTSAAHAPSELTRRLSWEQ
jgi:pimeloyl-ACP methyl ester carboxylesterase